MRVFKVSFLFAIVLLCATAVRAEMRDQKFTPEEIKKMSDTHINMLYNRLVKEQVTAFRLDESKPSVGEEFLDSSYGHASRLRQTSMRIRTSAVVDMSQTRSALPQAGLLAIAKS